MKRFLGFLAAALLAIDLGACGAIDTAVEEQPQTSETATSDVAAAHCNPSHNHKLCPPEGDPRWCDCIPSMSWIKEGSCFCDSGAQVCCRGIACMKVASCVQVNDSTSPQYPEFTSCGTRHCTWKSCIQYGGFCEGCYCG